MRVIAEAGIFTSADDADPGKLNHRVVHHSSDDLSLGTPRWWQPQERSR